MKVKILALLPLLFSLGCDSVIDQSFQPGLRFTNCDAEVYDVELVAGQIDTSGSTNNDLTTSLFNLPSSMIFTSETNFIVRDENNFRLRNVDIAGDAVTNFAGDGTSGTSGDGGAILSAQFDTSSGPGLGAVRSNGDILIPSPSHYIRKISGGIVTSFAGALGVSGTTNGGLSTARFNSPTALAIDSSGNIYVADTGNHCIRKIDTSDNVTTFAGLCGTSGSAEGNGTNARFNAPFSLTTDSSDNVYVVSTSTLRVHKITPSGDVTFFAGDGTAGDVDGTGTAAKIIPATVSSDSCDNLYITDVANKVKKITSDGVVTTIAGTGTASHTGDGGPALDATINSPTAVSVNPFTDEIFFAENAGHTVRKLVPAD